MNLERGSILFNRTIDQCRSIGRRGGRARARNLRARKTSRAAAVPAGSQSEDETAARQAIERIDAQCPRLKGCELRAIGRSAQRRATTDSTARARRPPQQKAIYGISLDGHSPRD
jgi:hypothetical protein